MNRPTSRTRGKPRGISKINAAKTHCDHGHPFEPPHLYVWHDRHGGRHRHCRTCNINRRQGKAS